MWFNYHLQSVVAGAFFITFQPFFGSTFAEPFLLSFDSKLGKRPFRAAHFEIFFVIKSLPF